MLRGFRRRSEISPRFDDGKSARRGHGQSQRRAEARPGEEEKRGGGAQEDHGSQLAGAVELRDQIALDQHAGKADDDRGDQQGPPIADAKILQQQISRESAHHVLSAMGEIDDVEHAEDHGEPETQQRVERAVDQPDQQLPEQRLRGNAEDLEHQHRLREAPRPAAPRWLVIAGRRLSRSPAGSRRP